MRDNTNLGRYAAYESISKGYNYTFQQEEKDRWSISKGLEIADKYEPSFMRVHLQNAGDAGYECMITKKNVPWRYDKWAEGSPYIQYLKQADKLLGLFIRGLNEIDILDKTTIIVMGDHGQTDSGWHPVNDIDASITTTIFWGAGIHQGKRIPYGEFIGLAPTILAIFHDGRHNAFDGKPIYEALESFTGIRPKSPQLIKEMLIQFQLYNRYLAQERKSNPTSNEVFNYQISELDFYDVTRFTDWPKFKTMSRLIEHNGKY